MSRDITLWGNPTLHRAWWEPLNLDRPEILHTVRPELSHDTKGEIPGEQHRSLDSAGEVRARPASGG